MKQLTQDEYYKLDSQFSVTPGPNECSVSGEHYILMAVLNELGYHPHSRDEACRLAERLLSNGYRY
jgi:hypothetical protein